MDSPTSINSPEEKLSLDNCVVWYSVRLQSPERRTEVTPVDSLITHPCGQRLTWQLTTTASTQITQHSILPERIGHQSNKTNKTSERKHFLKTVLRQCLRNCLCNAALCSDIVNVNITWRALCIFYPTSVGQENEWLHIPHWITLRFSLESLLQWFMFVWFMLYKQAISHEEFTANLTLIRRKGEISAVMLGA